MLVDIPLRHIRRSLRIKIIYDMRCWNCNAKKYDQNQLMIHHKDGNHDNNDYNNTVPVCELCHRILDAWIKNKQQIDKQLRQTKKQDLLTEENLIKQRSFYGVHTYK